MNMVLSTAAVVVTYHPRPEHLGHLAKIRGQIDLLVVVDNGSTEDTLARLRQLARQMRFTLIENGGNLGIAAALNTGVRSAQQRGCRWIALFDQDSEITDGFIASLRSDFDAYAENKNIMQIVPRYLDPDSGFERPVSRFADGGVFLTITSGSLFSMEAFERCGVFEECLFIYCVDDDYSLRLRNHGYFIGASKNAVLLHRSGHPTVRWFFGRRLITGNYRPEVRYYYARNKLWILLRYGFRFPRLIVPTLREFLTAPLKIALMEESSWPKITFFCRGIVDGLFSRMGPLQKTAKLRG